MSIQLPLFEPPSNWTPPSMSDLPTDWGTGRVGIDIETRDELLTKLGPGVRRGAYIVGISFAIEFGPSFYLPIAHGGGGNMDPGPVLRYFREMAKTFTGDVCGANLGYDLDFLSEVGIEFGAVRYFRDIQVADPLINELHDRYSMEAIAERWGIPGKDESLMISALAEFGYVKNKRPDKSKIWALHSKFVGPYAEQDAVLPLNILRKQEREIEEQELWGVYNLESRVLPVLVRMRRRGVRVDLDRLERVEQFAREQQQIAIDAVNHLTAAQMSFHDITKTDVLARIIRGLGYNLPQTATGKDSVTAAVLDSLDHPVGEHLRRAKKMSTLKTTFCDGVRHHLVNGRIHATFNQLRRQKDGGSGDTEGAAFGRLSSANPNLQNQPARDPEIGPMWRSIYVSDDELWACLDYSQQEPRQTVHFAVEAGADKLGKREWEAACAIAQRYRDDPSMDFHDMMTRMIHGDDILERVGADGFKKLRSPAKNIFLGLVYGMGGPKLCRDIGLPTAWRMSWYEKGRYRFTDFENADEAYSRAADGRRAGYRVRVWEVAGSEGQQLIDQFDEKVGFARKLAQACQEEAAALGVITTLSGRRCHFPLDENGDVDWLHKALNRRIQGSSADQTKEAVVQMDAAGVPLQLQVHDEVDFSTPSRAYAEEAAEIMAHAVELSVPMKVDVECGLSWGEVK